MAEPISSMRLLDCRGGGPRPKLPPIPLASMALADTSPAPTASILLPAQDLGRRKTILKRLKRVWGNRNEFDFGRILP